MMNPIVTFLALSLKKKISQRNDHASVSKSFPLLFRAVFSGSAFLFTAFLIIVFFFLTVLFPIKLYMNLFYHFLSHSGMTFSPFWRPTLFLHLLIHCTHKGHSYLKCLDHLQLFALKELRREGELHK